VFIDTVFNFSSSLNFRRSGRSLFECFLLNFKADDIVLLEIIILCSRNRQLPRLGSMVTILNQTSFGAEYNRASEKIRCAGMKMSSKNSSEIRMPVCVADIILPLRTSPTNGRNRIIRNSASCQNMRKGIRLLM